jgi:hypothetical protein
MTQSCALSKGNQDLPLLFAARPARFPTFSFRVSMSRGSFDRANYRDPLSESVRTSLKEHIASEKASMDETRISGQKDDLQAKLSSFADLISPYP